MTQMTESANCLHAPFKVGPQRVLVIGGLLLIVAGMIFGDIFAVFILHPNNTHIGQELFAATQAVATQDAATVLTHFQNIGGFLENRGTKVDAHSHIINFGYLALLLALAQPYVALGRRVKLRMAQLFLFGAVMLPPSVFTIHYIGLAFSPLKSIGWASVFADLGGLFIIIACVVQLVGLYRYTRGCYPADTQDVQLNCSGTISRLLLAGGAILLLSGFLFGVYYAATSFEQLAVRELEILKALVGEAALNNMTEVAVQLGSYGAVMAERGIKIAAHAHVNELGILLLLLAFVQPFIFLSQSWKRRWAIVMLVGAIGLPVAVFSELKFGLLAGGVADTCGLLMIIAVIAMMFGVLRHSGRTDAAGGEK